MPTRTLSRPTTFKQSINSGHIFDGTAPTGDLTFDGALASWEPGDSGGLFDFFNEEHFTILTQHLIIPRIALKMDGQSEWIIYVVDKNGTAHNWYDGLQQKHAFITDVLYLMRGEKLKIVTDGNFTANSDAIITIVPQEK